MAVILKVRKDSADLYISQNNGWKKVYVSGNAIASMDGGFTQFDPRSDVDGITPIKFDPMKEDEIIKEVGKPTIEVYKGTRFGKKVPNNWSIAAKLLQIGYPYLDVPKSGIIWEWTRDDLYSYADKLQKAIAAYKPGIRINVL